MEIKNKVKRIVYSYAFLEKLYKKIIFGKNMGGDIRLRMMDMEDINVM